MMEKIDFEKQIEYLRDTGYRPMPELVRVCIPDAQENLRKGIKMFCGNEAKWLPDYERIAEWLTDNKGRGLLLAGKCGLGKSLIGMRIIPLLLSYYCRKVVSIYTAQELNFKPDEIIKRHVIYIDDVGTEDISNIYGNKRIPFAELVDAAERDGKLLIISTNLDEDHLREKYGERVVDRLHAVTRKITISGKTMRG